MAAPATGAPPPSTPRDRSDDLVVEWRGPHALARLRDEVPGDADVLGTIPFVPGNALVLASASAHRHPGLFGAVRDWLAVLRSAPGGAGLRAVWLAVSDLGSPGGACVPWLHGLAADFGVEVIAPHGPLTTTVGGGLYVNRAEGGVGWRRFGPGRESGVVSCRFPVPAWEYQLPYVPMTASGLVTETVPAGLAVRPAGLPVLRHASPAFRVPPHPRIPKLVVGEPGVDVPVEAVAQLVERLPEAVRRELLFVPVSPSAATPEWAGELARLLDRDLIFTAGLQIMNRAGTVRTVVLGTQGEETLAPLAELLRHRPGAAAPEVVEVIAPPPGWVKHGARCYRRTGDPGPVLAEVLPGGLHVHSQADQPVFTSRFDPRSWTLAVGGEGRAVTADELVAASELLDGLTPHQCRTAKVHVLGTADPDGMAALHAHVRSVGAVLDGPAALSLEAETEVVRRWRVEKPAVTPPPPIAVTSAPVSTTSAPQPPPQEPETGRPGHVGARLDGEQRMPEQKNGEPVVEEPVARPRPAQPLVLADRSSTAAEQARLAASAGARYTEALAAVNVALSAWPMLKPDAKADYVAVCLYLGRGGAVALGEALAEGGEPFDGYLSCLMSGLRRLPTHRKVVLRQERVGGECPYDEGAVLSEPGFLSASAELDVTTAVADLDQLIWPVSGRRTSELMTGRAVEEIVFPAGRRFKALAVRTHEPDDDEEGLRPPRTALLARELLADEDPVSPEALERDRAALPRLERAWEARRAAELRLVEDADALARLTTPMLPVSQARAELVS